MGSLGAAGRVDEGAPGLNTKIRSLLGPRRERLPVFLSLGNGKEKVSGAAHAASLHRRATP